MALRGNFGTICKGKGKGYENKAFLTNFSDLPPNGKLFDHEKWCLMYLTYRVFCYWSALKMNKCQTLRKF